MQRVKIRKAIFGLGLLVLAGIYVRIVDLSTHFGHYDDIGVAKTILVFKALPPLRVDEMVNRLYESQPTSRATQIVSRLIKQLQRFEARGFISLILNKLYQVSAVPAIWTYAPLQFLLTYILVSPEQDYREILFWGRFPSFLFGVLGLISLIGFYWKYDRLKTPAVFIGLALVTFSWENIIYAKQMSSYSVGVFSAIWVAILLVKGLQTDLLSFKKLGGLVFPLILLCHAQYQILFMVPGFFLTLFLATWLRNRDRWYQILRTFILGGLIHALALAPLYFVFFRRHLNRGVNVLNIGPSGEYRFALDPALTLGEKLIETIRFFAKNFFVVFNANTAFVPDTSLWFIPLSYFFFFLFCFGVWHFFTTRDFQERMFGTFLLLTALAWGTLIVFQKITLGPSRHSLILLPYMAIVTAAGWNEIRDRLGRRLNNGWLLQYGHLVIVAVVASLFFCSFPKIVRERTDPFNEARIRQVLEAYQVDTVIEYNYTLNIGLMKSIISRYNYIEQFLKPGIRNHPFGKGAPIDSRVAMISHGGRLTSEHFEEIRHRVNEFAEVRQNPARGLPYPFGDYRVLYAQEHDSDVEVEFSRKAVRSGSNGFFLYVLKKSELPRKKMRGGPNEVEETAPVLGRIISHH